MEKNPLYKAIKEDLKLLIDQFPMLAKEITAEAESFLNRPKQAKKPASTSANSQNNLPKLGPASIFRQEYFRSVVTDPTTLGELMAGFFHSVGLPNMDSESRRYAAEFFAQVVAVASNGVTNTNTNDVNIAEPVISSSSANKSTRN